MRQGQYTLTPAHVHAHVRARLQKYLRLADHGPRCRADTLWTILCYAASRIISLAAACAALRAKRYAHLANNVIWSNPNPCLLQSKTMLPVE